jgi:hypothetical protein
MTNTIPPIVHQLNTLFKKVQAYKREHPETKLAYYPNSYASLLNAYREGDLGFGDCIAHLEVIAERARAEGRDEGLEAACKVICEGCRAGAPYEQPAWPDYRHIFPSPASRFICGAYLIRRKMQETRAS